MIKHLKSIIPIAIALSIFATTFCQNQNSTSKLINDYIAEYNSLCPIQHGVFTDIGITYKEGFVVFESIVDENSVDFKSIVGNSQQFKQNKFKILAFVDELDDFLKELKQTKTGLAYRYKGNKSGVVVTISFTTDEIGQILSYSENPRTFLNSEVNNTNNVMPIKIDNIQTATKMSVENGYIVYYIDIDESLYSMENLKYISSDRKRRLIEEYHNPDKPDFIIARACKKNQYGIEHRYIGNRSKKSVSIKIEWTEL